jgi:hypothetical protein
MPRKMRVQCPGAIYHIMSRGEGISNTEMLTALNIASGGELLGRALGPGTVNLEPGTGH